jgi:CHAT domain-containing protein/tetratricopeptide (TPR) repeat protein
MHKNWDQVLKGLGEGHADETTSDCPPDTALFELAAGLVSESEAENLLTHVTQCSHCSPVFSEDVSGEEQQFLEGLQSANPKWQARLARQITSASRETRVPPTPSSVETHLPSGLSWWKTIFTTRRLVWAATLLPILAATAFLGIRMAFAPNVNQLLAEAYAERRIMDLRIPGAKYAPLRVERSAMGSTTDQPQALLDANALISRELRKHPEEPKWLEAKARADLLEFNYEPAIQTLEHTLPFHADSPSLMIDLASAYYQRAVANAGRESDYGKALDYLGMALAKTPDDPVALFNRAVSEESLHLYDPAIRDWQHYLRVDPTGSWAEEARARLKAVQQKVHSKESSLLRPLLTTAEFATLARRSNLPHELDARVEDYLHVAVKEWLPRAFPQSAELTGIRGIRDAQTSLATLAHATQLWHEDSWLSDMLAGSHGSSFRSATILLSAAVRANESGDYAGGQKAAYGAGRLFRSVGNLAGELRAQAEEIYSHHLLYEGERCMKLAHDVGLRLRTHSYQWLQAETSLEESNCAGLLGDLGAARRATNRGTHQAEDHHYLNLYLRGLGFQADLAASLGDTQESFSLASKGLDLFWSDKGDLMKGYNLYTDLDTAADLLRLPNLQVALWQQATALIDLHPDIVQRAMAHRWYANSAYLANMPDLASREFATASSLFAVAPPTEATTRGKMDADIWLAGLEVRRGDLDQAAYHLHQVQRNLERAPSFNPEIGFYTTQAELSLRRHDSASTEAGLRSAIYLAEWALKSFPSEKVRRQWAKQTEPAYRNLVAWRFRQGDATSALELWEWYRGAELRARDARSPGLSRGLERSVPPEARNAPPIETPQAVTDGLKMLRQQTVIAYAVFAEGTAVWVYDDRGIFPRWISKTRTDLQDRAIQFQHLCSTPDSNLTAVRSMARALYDILLAPIEDRIIGGRTLVFEPDDVLSSIPMEALVDHHGRYLAETATVVTAPGFYHTARLRRPLVISPEMQALVVSVPVPGEQGLPPLPDADEEAQMVARNFRTPRLLEGPLATLVAVHQELHRAQVFHFVGHAVTFPEMNGLLLAERDSRTQRAQLINPGEFTSDSVKDLQLAVLSACDTGRVANTGNSGTESLVQALLYAGVPHVIATRWRVDSNMTSEFMQRFYAHLLTGDGVAASLRVTQMAIVSRTISAHPYYWAAFEAQGL